MRNYKNAGRKPKDVPPLSEQQVAYIQKALRPQANGRKLSSLRKLAKRYKVSTFAVAKARDGYYDKYFASCGRGILARKPETIFKEKVVRFLKTLNCWYVVNDHRSIRGIPDIFVCMMGHFIAMELKGSIKDTGRSARYQLQKHNLDEIRKRKGFGMTVYPENWEATKKKLKDIEQGVYYDLVDIRGNKKQALQRGLG